MSASENMWWRERVGDTFASVLLASPTYAWQLVAGWSDHCQTSESTQMSYCMSDVFIEAKRVLCWSS